MSYLNLRRVKFTNKTDKVDSKYGIFNPKNSTVNTFHSADQIIGKTSVGGDFGFGVLVDVTARDLHSTIIAVEFSARASITTNGIKNEGIINTGKGTDRIVGIATANLYVTATTVSQAIAKTANTAAITNAFASIQFAAIANGIDNSSGKINTGDGNDRIYGIAKASIAAITKAYANASAILDTVTPAPKSANPTAFAKATATSLVQANIIVRGINNTKGIINTGKGNDYISARATSSASTFAGTYADTLASATSESQALAEAVANAFAKAEDQAIAINNNRGTIFTGNGSDHIEAIAEAGDKAIAIDNNRGEIITGNGNDTIIAKATGSESYGIFGGNIYMGNGNDSLKASNFGSGVNINMGNGRDFVQGFGNAKIDGGAGFDILSFGAYKIEDFNISLGANNNQVILTLDGITMITTNFEQFNFDNGNSTIKYDDLVLVV
ncbi:hypothetical protein [Sphaerospermopsis torques-reginae]|uniref:Uncharacterized protein n=1 Tax=Sphaerospermopsis torques-reginae ITEP-024 TaxID=984208 RepID=A0ABX8WUT7_9CYAN|nr:hypothetical protein [Sphaerospermopsis torques-reginae]QYX30180.1 hypothetical protein K2F26_14660 [Sphaerospermopsis torques-reginae ITEP-024]